ncbi:hypothetical protein [Streptomyces sp. NPDC049590]|uniref:hypothetical protein n=1 Tax=Streptomyces sp. NPDC049590 TaxID=3154834 RepID=UPI00343EBC87
MHSYSFWDALAETPGLSPTQQRAIAEALSEQHPDAAARFFARHDLDHGTRDHMVRHARNPRVLAALLSTPVVTGSHLLTAAKVLGADAVLPQAMRSRCDPKEVLFPLIAQLDHRAARRVAMTECEITPQIRCALIRAAARPPAALSNRPEKLTEAEREELHAVVKAWHDDVWALLEAAPARPLWPELVHDADSGRLITNLLLNRADDLDDQVLLTCLESAFPEDAAEDADQDDLFAGVFGATLTLSRVASVIERHPRAFLLHGPTLRHAIATATGELTREIREEGIYESSWDVFEALAAVCTSPALLADAAQCLSQAVPPTWQQRQPPTPKWNAARAQAADALARNPFCPAEALALLTPFLTDATAAHFVEHPDEQVREAAKSIVDQAMERIHQTEPAPQQRDPLTGLTVPADDSLTQQDDPATVLSSLLPLKGPAARRRETAKAILDSRYADASHLRQLPAALVLPHTGHASAVAALLVEELGDDTQAWDRFRSSVLRLTPSAPKTLEKLIHEATADTP